MISRQNLTQVRITVRGYTCRRCFLGGEGIRWVANATRGRATRWGGARNPISAVQRRDTQPSRSNHATCPQASTPGNSLRRSKLLVREWIVRTAKTCPRSTVDRAVARRSRNQGFGFGPVGSFCKYYAVFNVFSAIEVVIETRLLADVLTVRRFQGLKADQFSRINALTHQTPGITTYCRNVGQ
ncbi:hypothetical protein Y032_0005g2628 [Ancylostoma ceylanicum]|uniref:Uncharacterized protein n=1 Tax=Ancylostoma ceylanicum TaxID=53326 RepID=A0A016VSK2_9BILA|nr:hypothetical protein Y032_0005g2628 [Ancylostoma ceylanicum]